MEELKSMIDCVESPIEWILFNHILADPILNGWGVRVRVQVPIGKYRVDMVLTNMAGCPLCVVECDGKHYHSSPEQMMRDAARSRHIFQITGLKTIRFTGRQINRNARGCVNDIITFLQYGRKPRRQW